MTRDKDFIRDMAIKQMAAYDRILFVLGTIKLAVEEYGEKRLSYRLMSDMRTLIGMRNIQGISVFFQKPYFELKILDCMVYKESEKMWYQIYEPSFYFEGKTKDELLDIEGTISELMKLMNEIRVKRAEILYTAQNIENMIADRDMITRLQEQYASTWHAKIIKEVENAQQ